MLIRFILDYNYNANLLVEVHDLMESGNLWTLRGHASQNRLNSDASSAQVAVGGRGLGERWRTAQSGPEAKQNLPVGVNCHFEAPVPWKTRFRFNS